MAIATPVGTARVREDLRDAWVEFDPSTEGFIARELFPSFEVFKRAGSIKTIPREAYLALINTKRTAGSATSTSSWSIEEDDYKLVEYAHLGSFDELDVADYDETIDLEEQETIRCRRIIETDLERDAAAIAFSSSVFPLSGTTGITLSNPWSGASGTPLDDIANGIGKIEDATGISPNTLVITRKGYRTLGLHADVRASITDTFGAIKPGLVPVDQLAQILGIDHLLVAGPGASYNSANPGATPVVSSLWNTDRALLTRIASGRLRDQPHLGRLFSRANDAGLTIKSWVQDEPPLHFVRCREDMVLKTHPTPPGFLIDNIL